MNPTNLRYTQKHEWIRIEGTKARIGITDHAQNALGDVVFVELPAIGDNLEAGKPFGVVESVKAVSDIYAPISGKVIAINNILLDSPETVNQDPYGEAWMVEVEIDPSLEPKNLLTAEQYEQFLQEED